MNVRMWQHAATRRNVATLRGDGVTVLDPDEGPMACGEYGPGRLPEPAAILAAIEQALGTGKDRLAGKHILVTAGPTHEPIDPVRYLANRSSGKQGFAIAAALARRGARVTLVAGPVTLATPAGVERIDVETAQQMADAIAKALPADAAVMVAAVGDWRAEAAAQKIKKGESPPSLALHENPDILATLAQGPNRPRLVIGFAAETENVLAHAAAKLERKGADWIVANDVSGDVMGGEANTVHLVAATGVESWEKLPKAAVADRLADRIADALQNGTG
jgi:phosphopantothenoylcysteine decarboxylase/phosphopantothenate--cysteine ligase